MSTAAIFIKGDFANNQLNATCIGTDQDIATLLMSAALQNDKFRLSILTAAKAINLWDDELNQGVEQMKTIINGHI